MAIEVSTIATGEMKNAVHVQFMTDIVEIAQADSTIKEKGEKYLTALVNAFTQEKTDYVISTKNDKTDDIKAADALRDKYYMALKKAVESFVDSPLDNVAKAAKTVNQVIKDHKVNTRETYDSETAKISSLVDDFQSTNADNITTLGLTAYVTALKQQNDLLHQLTMARKSDKQDVALGAMQKDRTATDEAYNNLVRFLNSYAFLVDEAAVTDAIQKFNIEIRETKIKAMGVKASSSSTDNNNGGSSSSGDGGSSSSDNNGGSSSSDGGNGGDDSGLSGGDDNDAA